jgi:hypothetical protein
MVRWEVWDTIVSRWIESWEDPSFNNEVLRLDWVKGNINPFPGAQWAMEGPLAIRIATNGLSPIDLVKFGFCA